MATKKKKSTPAIKDDSRVLALAECVMFALNSFPNKPVYNSQTMQMEAWHVWFKRAMVQAGYTLVEPSKKESK